MGFQPSGLVGHQRVGGGVRFVETVAGEFFHVVENFIGFLAGNAFGFGTLRENLAVFGHFFRLFLTHRAAQQIGAAE